MAKYAKVWNLQGLMFPHELVVAESTRPGKIAFRTFLLHLCEPVVLSDKSVLGIPIAKWTSWQSRDNQNPLINQGSLGFWF